MSVLTTTRPSGAAITAALLVAFAPAGVARTAALSYGAGLCALFGGSAHHYRRYAALGGRAVQA